MNKVAIAAIFRGSDGSLGYKQGEKYTLDTWTGPARKGGNTYPSIFIIDKGGVGQECEYSSIRSFAHNWVPVSLVDSIQSTKHSSKCLEKANDDEPIFVLRASDVTAPATIRTWANKNIGIQPIDKLVGATLLAEEMEDYYQKHFAKG